jgi:hypothetical protein
VQISHVILSYRQPTVLRPCPARLRSYPGFLARIQGCIVVAHDEDFCYGAL